MRLARPNNIVPLAALIALLFGAWMHWQVLDPRRVGWLLRGEDLGQNGLGLIAYLRAGAWPSLHDPLLMAPDGLSAALTDSNPLLALILRPLTGWLLPIGWQFTGLWLLLCMALQVTIAWRLIRQFVRRDAVALAGTALLAGSPVLFARFGHVNLCAQWLILWALLIFVTDERGERWRGWLGVVTVGWLVHPYLAVMVGSIWAGAQLRLLARAPRGRVNVVLRGLPAAMALAGLPWLLGYIGEPVVSTGTYGRYTMALDALWTPGDARYSVLLPAASTSVGQGFEGLNYLGAGGLGLVLVALLIIVRGRISGTLDQASDRPPADPAALLWLVPGFLVLTVIAIGPALIWRGQVLAFLPYPPWLIDKLDPVRASGRLFWPAGYTLMLAAIAIVARSSRGLVGLLLALIFQTVDVAPMLAIGRNYSAAAVNGRVFERTPDPRWDALVGMAGSIDFMPHQPYVEMAAFEEVAWRAIAAPRPVPIAWFYASREPRSIRERLSVETAAFRRGIVDPRRMTVILEGGVPPPLVSRAIKLDGLWVIPPLQPSTFVSNSAATASLMAIVPQSGDKGRARP